MGTHGLYLALPHGTIGQRSPVLSNRQWTYLPCGNSTLLIGKIGRDMVRSSLLRRSFKRSNSVGA